MAKADQVCANLMDIMRQEGSKDNPETLFIGTMRSATSVEIDGLVLDGDDVYIAAHLMAGYQFPLKVPYVSDVTFGHYDGSFKTTNPAVRKTGLKKGDLVAVMKCNDNTTYVILEKVVKGFCVGCRVRVNKSATHYATGQKIASFVKGSEYKVIQVGSGKCLLGGIMSWVNNSDLTLL